MEERYACFPVKFRNYSHLESLTSLTAMAIRMLCRSVKQITDGCKSLSPLYDVSTWGENGDWRKVKLKDYDCHKNPAPKRLLEVLYEHNTQPPLLDGKSRQAILDYIFRAAVPVRAEFFLYLFKDGGVYELNFCWIEFMTPTRKMREKLFLEMCKTSNSIRKLTIRPPVDNTAEFWNKSMKNVKFPNLKVLDLNNIRPGLEFPMENCPNLITFTAVDKTEVFRNLSRSLKSKTSMFESLSELNVPQLTTEAEVMLCLANFPNIVKLRLPNIIELVELLNQKSHLPLGQNAMKVLKNLRYIYVINPLYSSEIEALVQTCPNLEEMSLGLQDGKELHKLSQATKLRKLEIATVWEYTQNGQLSFTDHVIPLLEKIGIRLNTLSFYNFDTIFLAECAKNCPNLESFYALDFNSLVSHNLLMTHPFRQLKSLWIRPRCPMADPTPVCYILMGAPQLRHVEIGEGINFRNKSLKLIYSDNPLKMLQTFSLQVSKKMSDNILHKTMAKLLAASFTCGNLVQHDCGLTGLGFLEPQSRSRNNIGFDDPDLEDDFDEEEEDDAAEDIDIDEYNAAIAGLLAGMRPLE